MDITKEEMAQLYEFPVKFVKIDVCVVEKRHVLESPQRKWVQCKFMLLNNRESVWDSAQD